MSVAGMSRSAPVPFAVDDELKNTDLCITGRSAGFSTAGALGTADNSRDGPLGRPRDRGDAAEAPLRQCYAERAVTAGPLRS
jgi:hypothetical protein